MNKDKAERIFKLIERMSDDINDWMHTARSEGLDILEQGYADSRELLEEAGAVLQEWKAS